ncbi:MAG: hypothetical protein IT383_20180 [Deltaproteobacteria bacterium]|nr:hypothetical protein [Deltaproteobacteria bacterium]
MSRLLPLLSLVLATVARAQEPAPTPTPPPSTERCKIVVLNLVGRSLSEADAEVPSILTETLAGEVGVVSGCDVVSQQDIVAMLDYEKQKAVCTDGSDSCLAEVGAALGAERVVAGTIGKLGSEYVLATRLMNVKKGAVESRAEIPVSGPPEQLRRAAKNAGRRLFNAGDLPPDAKVDATPMSTTSEGPGALFWVGGAIAGVGLVTGVVAGSLAAIAELRLADPQAHQKGAIIDEGRIALAVAGGGAALAVLGGALLGISLVE